MLGGKNETVRPGEGMPDLYTVALTGSLLGDRTNEYEARQDEQTDLAGHVTISTLGCNDTFRIGYLFIIFPATGEQLE